MEYDLIVRCDTIVDGTGYPSRKADVAVQDGRVAKIGLLDHTTAVHEIDGNGLIVTPGVVYIHTRFDAELHWDLCCIGPSSGRRI